ncbi:MAG: hypothetical protein CW691_07250 [Candidatus Bathyarchaeum sp.]|nr:MAG: hypothetical protein CW691_07250 [Candidatus Bathyarchaeum sp.]
MKILFVANNLEHFFKDLFEGLAINNEVVFFRFSKVPNLLKFVIAAKRSDLVFVEYLAGAAWTISLLKSLVRRPIVVRCHRFELYERLRDLSKIKDTKKTIEKVDEIICVSNGIQDRLISFFPEAEKKSIVINNGISIGEKVSHVAAKHLEIGSMGFLRERKGFLGLIEAVSDLIDEGFDLTLHIAGKGALMESLKSRVRQLQKSDNIFIDGYISDEDYDRWFLTKDVYVQNSSSEGHCVSTITAMGHGLPVFSSDVCGATDSLKQSFIYPVGDIECLKNKLRWFYNLSPEEKLTIQKNNYEKALMDFNITHQAEKIANRFKIYVK